MAASRTSPHVADRRGGVASPAQLATAWLQAGGPRSQVFNMVAIALAESGGRLNAHNHNTNGTDDWGAWQINTVHGFPVPPLLTLDGNAAAAVKVYQKQGLKAWATWNNGAANKFKGTAAGKDVQDAESKFAPKPDGFDPLGVVKAPLKPIEGLIQAAGDPNTWKRVGLIVGGALAMLLGVYFIGREFVSSQVGTVAKTVINPKS